MAIQKTYKCSYCKNHLSRSKFGNNKNQKDGRHWYCKECWKVICKPLSKEYLNSYKERRNELEQEKRKDPIYRLSSNIRRVINKSIKSSRVNKNNSSQKYLGCTIEMYKKHIENQFKKGMCWDNYGEWEIDHIKPINTFNLNNENEFFKAFHYKNTRPLWKIDNMKRPKNGDDL